MAEATSATTSAAPESTLSWLDKAAADAMTVIERIYAEARTALDTISPETAPIVPVQPEPESPE